MRTLLVASLTAVAVAATASVSLAGHGGAASARFVTPKAGAMTGSTVTFKVKLANFQLDAASVGKMNAAGKGHLHFAMDGGKLDFPKYSGANGKLATQLGIAGKYSPAVNPWITYRNLPRGRHTLTVFLANNDHSPQGAKASVRFWVS